MVRALITGVEANCGQNAMHVLAAIDKFILSLPIAACSDNRIWMSHSLPSCRHLENFDQGIFDESLTINTIQMNESLRALTWDRAHNEICLEKLSEMWDVDMYLIGHKPQAEGCGRPMDNLIILASDHNHGCILPFELGKSYEPDELFSRVKRLASIA